MEADDINRLLCGLTAFEMRNSAEGAFDLRHAVRMAGRAYGADADLLAIAEGAVLTIRHPDAEPFTQTIRVTPELARLDRVSHARFLLDRVISGELTAAEADRELSDLQHDGQPYPWWLRILGVVLFATGFAPSVQATWREAGYSLVLGLVMGIVFLAAERVSGLRSLLPIAGPFFVALVAFDVLHAHNAPGGPLALMVPALFVLIPGDFLCAASAEIAVGQITPGVVRLAQSIFVLVEMAIGVVAAAGVSGVATSKLFESDVPSVLPFWVLAVSWIPFTLGLVITFSARIQDLPWMLTLTYLAWFAQFGITRWAGAAVGTFIAAMLLATVAGLLELSPKNPPRIVLIIGGFFALTVGSLALRGLETLDGDHLIQGLHDLRDAVTLTVALTAGLIAGSVLASVRAWPRKVSGNGRYNDTFH